MNNLVSCIIKSLNQWIVETLLEIKIDKNDDIRKRKEANKENRERERQRIEDRKNDNWHPSLSVYLSPINNGIEKEKKPLKNRWNTQLDCSALEMEQFFNQGFTLAKYEFETCYDEFLKTQSLYQI